MSLNVTAVAISSGKSDPYVSVKLGLQQHMKTEVKSRTLNPRYDETFDLLVYERSVEVREVEREGRRRGRTARLCLIDLLPLVGLAGI